MISQNDIHWIADEKPSDSQNRQRQRVRETTTDMPSKSRMKRGRVSKQSKKQNNEKAKNVVMSPSGEQPSEHTSTSSKVVSLKDLNEEDKQKIAQLIKELAKVGEEKENVVSMLKNERREFVMQMQKMEEEKVGLLGKRDLLVEEVKQCQHLLQYYQNLIAMQQNSILAQEKSRESERGSRNKSEDISHDSSCSNSSQRGSDTDDINVQDFHEEEGIADEDINNHSEHDFMQMSSRQYKDFLWQKKEKLQREQENLRKLLIASEESFAEKDDTLRVSTDLKSSSDEGHAVISQMPNELSVSSKKSKLKTKSPSLVPSEVCEEKSPSSTYSLLPPAQTSGPSNREESAEEVLFSQDFEGLTLNSSMPACHLFESNVEHYQNHCPANPCDDSQILEDIFFVV